MSDIPSRDLHETVTPDATFIAHDSTERTPYSAQQHAEQARRAQAANHTSWLLWILGFLLVLLMIRYFVPPLVEEMRYAWLRGQQRADYDTAGEQLQNVALADLSDAYQLVSKRVSPSVVYIDASGSVGSQPVDEQSFLFGRPDLKAHGQGSGFVIDADGYIVTNNHVVSNYSNFTVQLTDGRSLPAEVVGSDPLTDIAVLKIPAGDLIAAQWGDSEKLDTGGLVWAVGSPYGLQQSITFGIVSAKNRAGLAGTPYQDFLQTDAAVNPGNSGGPLVNWEGKVVGVNTAIYGKAFQGISFAVPSEIAQGVYQRIKEQGQVDRGWLGVGLAEVDARIARQLNLPKNTVGALVTSVVPDAQLPSPASRAGIEPGDVIVSWDGIAITGPAGLSRAIGSTEIGKRCPVELFRNGRKLTLEVVVETRPQRLP